MESLLKESIKQNQDLESKRLSNKVLKMLEGKIKQQESAWK